LSSRAIAYLVGVGISSSQASNLAATWEDALIYDVVIVGAGFSAIAVTCNLIQSLPPSASIAVIGDDPGFGRGTAYRTELYLHRLNVPAGRMSLHPDRPSDFVDWLKSRNIPLKEGDFASRGDYGLYVRDTLARLLRKKSDRCRMDFIKAKASGCFEQTSRTLIFDLNNGEQIGARNVVLCLGVGNASLPADVAALSSSARTRVVENPWRLSWMNRVKPDDRVCILGSGLTMIDQVLALQAHGHRGPIDVLSRRGLAPHGHVRTPPAPVEFDIDALPTRSSELLRLLRAKGRLVDDWRAIMDGLRPFTQQLWQRLPIEERRRFLRHALPWWSIHRHRVAPNVYLRFKTLLDAGTVRLKAGFLQSIDTDGEGLRLSYRKRGSRTVERIEADWLINCTGMERAGIGHSPLLEEMTRQGLIEADPLRLGIRVNDRSQVVSEKLNKGIGAYVVGALAAGQFWEITAVPDIRVQARKVAAELMERMPSS
jgi:uncharacterized NAD(P)/FAD-binding protein YdhS